MKKMVLLPVLLCSLTANTSIAEADGQAVFKSLSELLLGGTWVTSADGESIEHTYAKAGGGKFLRNEMKGGPLQGTAVLGVNPADSVCTWWAYLVDGSIVTMTIRQEKEGVWLMETIPSSPARYKGRIFRVDANTIKEETIEMVVRGEKQSSGFFTWKRVGSPAEADTKSAIEMLKAHLGDWEYKGEQNAPPAPGLPFGGAGEYSGTLSARMILGGNFLESHGTDNNPGGKTEIKRVIHYDPTIRKYVVNQYTSEGTAERSEETVSADGKVWKSMTETTTKTGAKVLIRSTGTFKEDGNRLDSVTEVSTDGGATWKEWFRETARRK